MGRLRRVVARTLSWPGLRLRRLAARMGSWPGRRRWLGTGAGPGGKCAWCRLPEGWHRNERGQVRGCRHARSLARVTILGPRGIHHARRRETSGETAVAR